MNPHVLVISNYSGAENPIRPEAEIFVGLAQAGWKIWVMTPEGGTYSQKLKEAGCNIIPYHPKTKFDRKAVKIIQITVKENDISIVHAFNSKAIATAAWALLFNRKVKLLSYRGYTGNIHWYDPTLYLSFLHPRIDYMICLAESVREQYIKNGVRPDRAITINKGHHSDWYDHIEPANLEEFQLDPDSMICSFVANFRTKMKGVRYLIEAVADLPDEVSVQIIMLGHGLATPEVKSWLTKYKVEDRFIFAGFSKDASAIVKACDVSISLSLFGEATQKAMIEAMYLGNPVIISDISGNRGMVEQGEGGYVVPPADSDAVKEALIKLNESEENRKNMGEAAKQHMKQFLSVDKTRQDYADFYRKITSSTRKESRG